MNHRRNRASPDEGEARYRSLFDAAADGLIIVDLQTGCVLEANSAACAMHGFTREAFIGLRPADFLELDSQLAFDSSFRAFRAGSVVESPLRRRDAPRQRSPTLRVTSYSVGSMT